MSIARDIFKHLSKLYTIETLLAIYNGYDTLDALEKQIKLPRHKIFYALKHLDSAGLIKREMISAKPRRTKYSLTEKGKILAETILKIEKLEE